MGNSTQFAELMMREIIRVHSETLQEIRDLRNDVTQIVTAAGFSTNQVESNHDIFEAYNRSQDIQIDLLQGALHAMTSNGVESNNANDRHRPTENGQSQRSTPVDQSESNGSAGNEKQVAKPSAPPTTAKFHKNE